MGSALGFRSSWYHQPGNVYEVKEFIFDDFIRRKDVAMVLFYNKRTTEGSEGRWAAMEASVETNKPNHAYVAVDCWQQKALCEKHNIDTLPTFKLFSYGHWIDTFKRDMTKCELVKLVEECPVLDFETRRLLRAERKKQILAM